MPLPVAAVGHAGTRPPARRGAQSAAWPGVATPVHLGRSMASFEVVVSDEQGRRVCTSRITCALIDAPPAAG